MSQPRSPARPRRCSASARVTEVVTSRDMPLLQACAMIFCAAYLILMLIADVTAILANPRLRSQ